MAWRLAQCTWREKARLEAYLREGWEPFAVSETDSEPTIWLRLPATPQDAGVAELPAAPVEAGDELPRRPRMEPEVGRRRP